jgi:hypothetical protein
VQTESLTSIFSLARDEECVLLEFWRRRMRERHRRSGCAEIDNEQLSACRAFCCRYLLSHVCAHYVKLQGRFLFRVAPLSWRNHSPLDRWLCVPVFRQVCPCHVASVCAQRRCVKNSFMMICRIGPTRFTRLWPASRHRRQPCPAACPTSPLLAAGAPGSTPAPRRSRARAGTPAARQSPRPRQ